MDLLLRIAGSLVGILMPRVASAGSQQQNFFLATLENRLLLSASPLPLAAAAASLDASDAHSAIIWANRDKKGFSDEGDRDD